MSLATLAQLQEKRNALATSIRAKAKLFNDNGKKWPSEEERKNYEQANADYDKVQDEMKQVRTADDVEKRLNNLDEEDKELGGDRGIGRDDQDGQRLRGKRGKKKGGGDGSETAATEEMRLLAFQAWSRYQLGLPLKKQQREAIRKVRMQPHARVARCKLLPTENFRDLQANFRSVHPSLARRKCEGEFRTLSGQNFGLGGAVVLPQTLIRALEINMLAYGGMLQVSDVIRTLTGEPMAWPTADDTSNEGEQLGEATTADNGGAGVDPSFGATIWNSYKFSSKAILVPYELLEDSAFNLAVELGSMLGERLGRIGNRRCTTGTGSSQPRGMVNAAALGVTTASPTAILDTDLISLIHSVDPAYRLDASFMCHDSILLAIRLLKDLNGRFVWQPGLDQGMPDKLAGYNYTPNQHMDSTVTALKKVLAFGNFKKYKIRQVGDVRMYRLQERYREQDKDGFIAFQRMDGNLLNAGTNPIKYLQMHS